MTSSKFIRVIQRREVLTLSFGAMIGWSWMALSGGWVEEAGSLGAVLAFVGGGIAVILVGLTYAELAAAMPLAGGEHVYSYRALGRNLSFVCTWAILLAYVSVVTFEAVALPTVVEYIFPGYSIGYLWTVAGWDVELTWVLVGVGTAVVMTAINVAGIKTAARLQMLVTSLIVIAGLVLIFGAAWAGELGNTEPLFSTGYKGVLGVLVIVPVMLVGFDVIPQSAEEIDLPYDVIGKLLVTSIVMAVSFYLLIIWGVSMGLDSDTRQAASIPTADAAGALVGDWGRYMLLIGGIGGILTSWNAFVIGASRAMYALAEAGQLPAWIGDVHPRFRTPWKAIILIGVLCCLSPLCGRQIMVWLVDAGSFGTIVAYAMVAWSFLVLRRKEPDMPRPYVVPQGGLVGVLAVVLSLAIACLFLPFSPAALIWPYEWAIVGGWCLFGAVLMWFARGREAKHPTL